MGFILELTRARQRIQELETQIAPPSLVYQGDMDINEVSSILIDKFPDAPLYLPDSYYKTCTIGDIGRFLTWDSTNKLKYTGDPGYNCDAFAWRLKGNITIPPWSEIPFFVIWTDKHALNLVIVDTGEVYFVEPQLDKIQTSLESGQGTEIRFIGG